MKELTGLLALMMVLLMSSCSGSGGSDSAAKKPSDTDFPRVVFREYEHHFGKVREGEKVSWQFVYENQGTADLVIANVATTCGCTVSKYDKKPVRPGEKGKIEVVFDSEGRSGMQTKTVSVLSNDMMPVILLKITAEVQENN